MFCEDISHILKFVFVYVEIINKKKNGKRKKNINVSDGEGIKSMFFQCCNVSSFTSIHVDLFIFLKFNSMCVISPHTKILTESTF